MESFVRVNHDSEAERFEIEPWKERWKGMTAGFTGRNGGISQHPYDSLNMAFHVGDAPEDVIKNRERLASDVGFQLEDWTCGEQVHSSNVAIVRADDKGKGSRDRESAFQDTDGLLTNVPGVLLASYYADCVPLYFHDPVNKVVGLAHAGWKGTVASIAVRMIECMEDTYGSRREDIHTAIGPSIGSCCYEVDDRVMSHVYDLEKAILGNEQDGNCFYTTKSDGKSMLNLKEMNRQIMIKAGILPSHIECTSWCTSCSNDLFFSYRKDGGTTGRMASWIGLK